MNLRAPPKVALGGVLAKLDATGVEVSPRTRRVLAPLAVVAAGALAAVVGVESASAVGGWLTADQDAKTIANLEQRAEVETIPSCVVAYRPDGNPVGAQRRAHVLDIYDVRPAEAGPGYDLILRVGAASGDLGKPLTVPLSPAEARGIVREIETCTELRSKLVAQIPRTMAFRP